MQKILITGFSGFVSRHFLDYLYENKLRYEILGIDVVEPKVDLTKYADVLKIEFQRCNLLDTDMVNLIVGSFVPNYVLHLAAFSSVAYSWKHPGECFSNNTCIFINLTSAVREVNPECRILSVGSSEEYGDVSEDMLPLREGMTLDPVSPYAVARVAQEMMSKVYVNNFGMKIVLTRSFNHMGPYQDERFVIPSFIRRILDVKERGELTGEIETGDTSIIRDFVDVRDVVRAYYLLLTKGTPGEVYNICKGKGVSLAEVISEIASQVGVIINSNVNPEFVRPNDNHIIIGSADKIEKELGWKADIPIEKTLRDMIEYMR